MSSTSPLSFSSKTEASPKITTGDQKEDSRTLPPENTEPDYFEDLLRLAETKAREFEAEELRANAPVLLEEGVQCNMSATSIDMDFMEEIKQYMLDMNPSQKMNFQQKVYKSIIDVLDSATDFPTTEQINDNPTTELEKNVQPNEVCLMRELASVVLAAKKTSELTNSTNNGSGMAISNTTTDISNSITNQTSNIINIQPKKKVKTATAKPITLSAGGVTHLALPDELLNEAIKISLNGGGRITARDGNMRRVYRIYPRESRIIRVPKEAAVTTTTKKNAVSLIVPQTLSNNNTAHSMSTSKSKIITSTKITVPAAISSQISVVAPQSIRILARPKVIKPASLGVGTATPTISPPQLTDNRPNETTTNQSSVTARRYTQNVQRWKSPNLPAHTLVVENYNDDRISPTIITTTAHDTPFAQSIVTSQENSRRFKRARWPHVTESTNVHGTHGIATTPFVGPSAVASGTATNVGYTTATSTTPFLATPPFPVGIWSASGINTNTPPRTAQTKLKFVNNQSQSLNTSAGIIAADEFTVKEEEVSDDELDFPSLLL